MTRRPSLIGPSVTGLGTHLVVGPDRQHDLAGLIGDDGRVGNQQRVDFAGEDAHAPEDAGRQELVLVVERRRGRGSCPSGRSGRCRRSRSCRDASTRSRRRGGPRAGVPFSRLRRASRAGQAPGIAQDSRPPRRRRRNGSDRPRRWWSAASRPTGRPAIRLPGSTRRFEMRPASGARTSRPFEIELGAS